MMPIAAMRLRASPPPTPSGYRYWRIFITSIQTGINACVAEVAMAATAGGSNLCVGGTAIASGQLASDYSAAKAFDGDPATAWISQSGGLTPWVGYLFPSGVSIVEVKIQSEDGGMTGHQGDPKNFQIQRSSDGSTWVTEASYVDQTGWSNGEIRTFSVP